MQANHIFYNNMEKIEHRRHWQELFEGVGGNNERWDGGNNRPEVVTFWTIPWTRYLLCRPEVVLAVVHSEANISDRN